MATMKKGPKFILIALAVVGGIFGLRAGVTSGLIPMPGILKTVSTSKVSLAGQTDAAVTGIEAVAPPSTRVASVSATPITFDIWEWNAYFGIIYANGGKQTTKGSLMEKYGVNLTLHREDSNTQMKADLLACAKQLHDGEKACSSGAAAIIVMGDGGGQWLADLNPQLKKLGPEYQAVIIGAVGRSNGEDALLGPASWKTNPQTMKGGVVVGVIRDGDWNIALNYEGSNGLKNNPDLTTYDPDAVNWISAPDEDYIKAVTEVYIPNRCEDRKEIKDGHLTGKTVRVCPDGVVTWTPGDEQAVHGRSGTVKIVSSHEYASQMPSVIIGIKKFFNANRDEIQNLLAATFQASDQIKAFDTARRKAGEISAAVYSDKDGAYWYNYFVGLTDQGTRQPLGGSAVFNLEDNMNFFGLDGKHNNNMRATYETFGRIAAQNYPNLFKDNPIPPYAQAVDTSYIFGAQAALSNAGTQSGAAESVSYAAETTGAGTVLGHKAVYVNFALNSDQPLPESLPTLEQLKDALAINSQLALQIDGYTDNSGSDDVNRPLSERRALAVKAFFQRRAPSSFPNDRFKSVAGHGSANPISANKALNRRVEITQIGE